MDLRLNHQVVGSQIAGSLFCFFRCRGCFAARRSNAKFLEQFLRLVFVDVHSATVRVSRALSLRSAHPATVFNSPHRRRRFFKVHPSSQPLFQGGRLESAS
jgi:hypothetical protein